MLFLDITYKLKTDFIIHSISYQIRVNQMSIKSIKFSHSIRLIITTIIS